MLNRLFAAMLKAVLVLIEGLFFVVRKKEAPLYPYDKKAQKISLPKDVEKQLQRLIVDGNKAEAVRQVTRLTGANLRVSKDYVDHLVQKKRQRV